jgi:hypothetical protein
MTTQDVQVNFSELMNRLLGLLTEKERDVIQRRFSLDGRKRETLDKIGQGYSITRERVRQIEAVALKKLTRISMDPSMQQIHKLAFAILQDHGRVMAEDVLVSEMIKNLTDTKDLESNAMKLAMKVSAQLVKQEKNQFYRTFWRTSDLSLLSVKDCINNIKKTLKKKKDVMEVSDIAKALGVNYTEEIIQSVLQIDWEFKQTESGWGLSSWRHINPRSIKDKIMIIFKDLGKPLHFNEVINHVIEDFKAKKMVTHQAIHNELIRHDEFVLVGRGLYALAEWGLPSGTVCDLIKSVLVENNAPMKRQAIIKAVLAKRDIRLGTISLNLQKYPFFKRVGRAIYEYDESLDNRKRKRRG